MTAPPGTSWAVVLGASCGTGGAIARAVAADPGLHVFGVHRGNHAESAEQVERDVARAGRRCHFRRADAGTHEGAEAGAAELAGVAGQRSVHLFVHSIANASVGRLASGEPDQLHPRQFEKTFDAMAHSFVYWVQAMIARDLLAPGARLLALSNPMGPIVVRNTALIAAAKAALGAYVRHLAHELGPSGHRVNMLEFGAVMTSALERTFGAAGADRLQSLLYRAIPAQRLCTLEEVGRVVSFLAGDGAGWFNGATIDFTGGETQGLMNASLGSARGGER